MKKILGIVTGLLLVSMTAMAGNSTINKELPANSEQERTTLSSKNKAKKYSFTLLNFFSDQNKSKVDTIKVEPKAPELKSPIKD
jgi:hypothetical protein